MERVLLRPEQVSEARSLAEVTSTKWGRTAGHYRNLLRTHFNGKLGEIGIERWLSEHGIEATSLWRNIENEALADFQIRGTGVDAKTWDARYWEEWGRCVAVQQLPALRKKSEAIIWATIERLDGPAEVLVRGWSTLDEVSAAEVRTTGPISKKVINHQLDSIRPIESFLTRFSK